MSPWRLRQLARTIPRGAVFAYPTDTIWGLGCHPVSAQGIQRLIDIKRRPLGKGLILLSSSIEYYAPFIDPDFLYQKQDAIVETAARPTTWLVPAAPRCPHWLTGGGELIAVRLCSLEHIRILCDRIGYPLVSTSANLSGQRNARGAMQVHRLFAHQLDFIVEGFATSGHTASRIVNLLSGDIVRA